MQEDTLQQTSLLLFFSRLLANVLEKWWVFVAVVSLPTLLTIAVTLWVLEPSYTSKAVVRTPESRSMGAGLASLVGSDPLLGSFLGADFGSKNEINILWTLLSSTELHNQALTQFQLAQHYKFKSPFHADLLKAFRKNLTLDLNDENMLVVSFSDTDPEKARQVVEFLLDRADSAYNYFNTALARQSREFFETRMREVRKTLDSTEFAFGEFQKTHGLYLPEVQLTATFEHLAALQLNRDQVQVEIDLESSLYGDQSTKLQQLKKRHQSLNRLFQQSMSGQQRQTGAPSLKDSPALIFEYMRYELEIRVQQGIYRLLRQKFEENSLEEAMTLRNLQVLEAPWANNKRTKPPRTALVVLVFGIFSCLGLAFCTLLVQVEGEMNKPESAFRREVSRIRKFFGLRP